MTFDPLHTYKHAKRNPEQQKNWDEFWDKIKEEKKKENNQRALDE